MKTELRIHCPVCEVASTVMRKRRATSVGKSTVTVADEWMHCPSCGEDFYTAAQADQLHLRAIERIRTEEGLLTPDKIKRIRNELGLTQREFELLLGTGEKTCVRWETGRVCQSTAADRLIRLLAANRANVAVLAGISGAQHARQ